MKLETEREIVGIVPAGGKGTRLYPYPGPKELFPVGYQEIHVNGKLEKRPKAISQYLIENMVAAGARKLYIIVSGGKEDVMRYYGNGHTFGVQICYLMQEKVAGMAHAINLVTPWLSGDEIVIMGMPDTVVEPSDAFTQIVQARARWDADLVLGLFHTERPHKFGMVGLDDDASVIEHVDKPRETDLRWCWGICCWTAAFVQLIDRGVNSWTPPSGRELVLGDIFDMALEKELVTKGVTFENGSYLDIGTYDELRLTFQKYAR